MKKLLLILTLFCSLYVNSQVTTIISNEYNDIISSEYREEFKVYVYLTDKITQIEIDLDGNGDGKDNIVFKYKITTGPTLSWNNVSLTYNILFTLKQSGNNPVGGLIDLTTKSIMLFYKDSSTILYIGEGVKINL